MPALGPARLIGVFTLAATLSLLSTFGCGSSPVGQTSEETVGGADSGTRDLLSEGTSPSEGKVGLEGRGGDAEPVDTPVQRGDHPADAGIVDLTRDGEPLPPDGSRDELQADAPAPRDGVPDAPREAETTESEPHAFPDSSRPPEGPPDAGTCPGRGKPPSSPLWTMTYKGLFRRYYVHVPKGYDPTKAWPVVFDVHGHSSSATQQMLYSGMNGKADREGFIAVHPQGFGTPTKSWNAGSCCPPASTLKLDDLEFFKAMLAELEKRLCVDRRRIHVAGMSNGAFMAYRLACELSHRIASVGIVAGVLVKNPCSPSRPVPVLAFHGTKDNVVPINGSKLLGLPPVSDAIGFWVAHNRCGGTPKRVYQFGDVTCDSYSGCTARAEVRLCTVKGGGHTWPGGLPVPHLGHTTKDINATDQLWHFFKNHPLP